MEHFRNHELFREAETDTSYEQAANGLLNFRSESACFVYWQSEQTNEEILAGYGSATFEIEMPPGHFIVRSEGRVWIAQNAINQLVEATSEEVFTTLDRPAPLSPEMAAIARFVRQNEIEREKIRETVENVERDNAELRRQRSGNKDRTQMEDSVPPEDDPIQPKPGRSKAKPQTPDGKADAEPETPADPDNNE